MTQEQMQADTMVAGAAQAHLMQDRQQKALPIDQASGMLLLEGSVVAPDPIDSVILLEQHL